MPMQSIPPRRNRHVRLACDGSTAYAVMTDDVYDLGPHELICWYVDKQRDAGRTDAEIYDALAQVWALCAPRSHEWPEPADRLVTVVTIAHQLLPARNGCHIA